MFSIGLDTGLIRLVQYDPATDPKFVEVNVIATDNLGTDPSLTSTTLVKVWGNHCETGCCMTLHLNIGVLY